MPLGNSPGGPAAARSKLILEQAAAALQAGDAGDAERLLRKHLLEQPTDAAALSKLAELAVLQSHIEEATALMRRAAGADPTLAGRMGLIRHLLQFVGAKAALAEIELLLPVVRGSFEMMAMEAAARGALGDHDRQIAIYETLLQMAPNLPALWKSLGDALKTVGRTDQAIAAIRQAIKTRPGYGEAWWTLSNFKSFTFGDRDISAMKKALRGKLDDEDALHFHFALGQAFEQRGEYPQSFKHYDAGNAIRRKGLASASTRISDFIDRAIATYTPELYARHEKAGCQSSAPIFVLGLHRSGSTLIEQILASHPQIEGTVELTVMPQIWDRIGRMAGLAGRDPFEAITRLADDDLRKIGEEYVERTAAFRTSDRPHFVDKLPANWMNLGLIRLALPNARIIDARRHPMACGFSNFKQNYTSGITFSYSQESIGHFYRDYLRFMEHIARVQPGVVHRVLNERLIDDPEGETRRLLDYVGVPFDPACLEFHKTKRAIATPSAEQVRRPINREGLDQWRHYEQWLGPMKEALGPALERWDR